MKPTPQVIRDLVAQKIVAAPQTPYKDIGKEFGISEWMVWKIAHDLKLERNVGPKPKAVPSC
jgi:hypothetical protein